MSGGFYGDEQVRALKAKVDLVQLVGEYTALKKAGSDFVGCCCFHQERTPSMHVYPDESRFHCFGCGAHGDAFELVQQKERCDFREAVEFLARRVGVTLVPVRGGASAPVRAQREQLLHAMAWSTRWHQDQLWSPAGRAALDYLHGRGFTDDTIKHFRLGWSPGRGELIKAARAIQLPIEHLVAVNLATDNGDRVTDRFFERVMFPICDRFSQPIAFSGRLLPEAEQRMKAEGKGVGKYINSTDTPLYHKGSVIWNLDLAKAAARTTDRILLMEGPTDVMAAHQAGISECVACLGTALTVDQCHLLSRTVGPDGKILLVFDGDKPGIAAASKAVRTGLAAGVLVHVVTIPDGLDIAELLTADQTGSAA
ncbi:MAG: hypothetical protein RL030_2786 [Pseudomonadota bacterium]|jgi:DNA primase